MKLLEHIQKHVATTNPVLPTVSNTPLIQHIITTTPTVPEIAPTSMFEYIYGSNGTFVRARRQGLEAIAPVSYYKVKNIKL